MTGSTEYDKMVLTYHFPVLYSHDTLHGMCSGHTSAPDLTLSNEIAEGSNHSQPRERGNSFFLYWCISEVPQGNGVACPPPSPVLVLVGRQR